VREEWRYAGFLDRLFGDFCDGLVACGVTLPIALLEFFLIKNFGLRLPFSLSAAAGLLWFVWSLTYLVGQTGQSWGRKLAGLKVVDAEGEPVGFWRALGRNLFAMYISAPLLYLGFLWVIWDGEKQAWHCKVFRTFVLQRVVL
jgi:uncharacterized RDD family membrane protein YckC